MEVITTHINADFDSLASMLAAKKLYPDATLVFPGSQEKGLRNFFLHSTIYLFEPERLKNVDMNEITRLILVDVRQISRIGKFQKIINKPGLDIHIYDHHPPSEDDIKGSLKVVKEVGATTTLFTQIFKERGIEVTPDEATVMMMGIYEDTGSLIFSSTTEEDYRACAYLLSRGANLNIVAHMISREMTIEQVSLLNELIQTANTYRIHGIKVVIARAASEKYVGDFAMIVHKLRDIENLDVLFALAVMEDRISLVGRSRIKEVNVGEIVAELGGGGHATAASATIKDLTLIQAEERLVTVLSQKINPPKIAREIMSFPVKTVAAKKSIEEAGEIMGRYHINILPVLEKERLAGLISRNIIDKAGRHGLGKLPVKDYMVTDFCSLRPDTPWSAIQDLAIKDNQQFLPVIEKEKVVGAITHADVLRVLKADLEKEPEPLHSFEDGLSSPRMKMIASSMKERLPGQIFQLLKDIGETGEELKVNVCAVGGFVRDLLLGYPNYDIDVVVEGNGINFARAFSVRYPPCKVRYHKKFTTARITTSSGLKVDIASAREEYYPHPAALPSVELSSLKNDLHRRDFTINTLAIQLNAGNFGKLIDYFGAQMDIKNKVVRIIHNLSFIEDPTRILRAIRFEQRFGFRIGKPTARLIDNLVKRKIFERLQGKRIFAELKLILEEKNPLNSIKKMAKFDLIKLIHPHLTYNEEKKSLLEHISQTLSWFELLFLEERCQKWMVYFLGLTDGLKKEEFLELTHRLDVPTKDIRLMAKERGKFPFLILQIRARETPWKNSEIYQLLKALSPEILLYMMAKNNNEAVKKIISLYFTRLKSTSIMLNGKDLIDLGIAPGKIFQEIFSSLLKEKLDARLKSKEDEISFVRKNYLM